MTKFWKDISTAPRDGTVIIVYRPGDKYVVGIDHWEEGRGWWFSRPHLPPTHWCHHHEIRPQPDIPILPGQMPGAPIGVDADAFDH